jgi:hypothetical protein
VTTIVGRPAVADSPLAPIRATLSAAFGPHPPPVIAPGLVVCDATRWRCAQGFTDGTLVADLLASAGRQWRAAPHAAAALAWKAYTYALALPAVLGWAGARRVPLVRPPDVLVRLGGDRCVLTVGLRPSIRVAVLPSDPIARRDRADVVVVAGESSLLDALRETLLESHLRPLMTHLRGAVRLGSRTLLGSLASGVAYAVLQSADALPGSPAEDIETLLTTLGVCDLVDLVPGPGDRLEVRRRTCCLAFTLPTPKVCAGCCLRRSFP